MEPTSCGNCPFTTAGDFISLFDHLEKHEIGDGTPTEIYKCAESMPDYECRNCDYTTPWRVSLLNHIYNRECNRKVIDLIDFSERKEKIKEFECDFCTFKTIWRKSWRNHILRKHAPVENITWFFCEFCPYKCKFAFDLKIHQLKHGIKIEKNQNISALEYKLFIIEKIKYFGCLQCSYKSSVKQHLRRHMVHKHTPIEEIKWYPCDQCSHQSKTRDSLRNHKKVHNPDKKYECMHCLFKTGKKETLKNHILCKHTPDEDINWFYCNQCDYKSQIIYRLRKHISTQHLQ